MVSIEFYLYKNVFFKILEMFCLTWGNDKASIQNIHLLNSQVFKIWSW